MDAATSERGIARTRDRALTIRNQARSPMQRGTRPAQDCLARRFADRDRRKFSSDPRPAQEGAPLHENESLPKIEGLSQWCRFLENLRMCDHAQAATQGEFRYGDSSGTDE